MVELHLTNVEIALEKDLEYITFEQDLPVEIRKPEVIHIPPEALQIHLS